MNKAGSAVILGIESSCDETSAAVVRDGVLLSNIVAGQEVHRKYGGVVPELASRDHQKNIVPAVDIALKEAGVDKKDLSAVAFTRGPGLLGSLLVGTSFAKAFTLAAGIPLIEVNHMQAHVLSLFIRREKQEPVPSFPFLCLTVSGGHTQIVKAESHLSMKVIGETQDDAAGEAFDKMARFMGLPYPGGPEIDKLAREGNPGRFIFSCAEMDNFNFSFSGIKTSVLYFLREQLKKDPRFIEANRPDLCASIQHTIISALMKKVVAAAKEHGINDIGIAGGVSANSGLRKAAAALSTQYGWNIFIPPFEYCTDNAAMIALTGYYKFLKKDFSAQNTAPLARMTF